MPHWPRASPGPRKLPAIAASQLPARRSSAVKADAGTAADADPVDQQRRRANVFRHLSIDQFEVGNPILAIDERIADVNRDEPNFDTCWLGNGQGGIGGSLMKPSSPAPAFHSSKNAAIGRFPAMRCGRSEKYSV